jgi:hypothetical protein
MARIKLGPVTTPWIAQGCLSLDGERRVVGGIGAARRTSVEERPDGARLSLPVAGLEPLAVHVHAPIGRFVGWRYADPGGHGREVGNCSVAAMDLEVSGRRLHSDHGAVVELGAGANPMHLTLQPYDD